MKEEEDAALSFGQREAHREATRRNITRGTEVIGHLLVPLLRGDGMTELFASKEMSETVGGSELREEDTSQTFAPDKAKTAERRAGAYEDGLVLIGALLFLLGTGLDEESVLVLIAVLVLLT